MAAGSRLLIVALAFACGVVVGGYRRDANVITIHDVEILRHDSQQMYFVRAAGREFELKFCRDYLPDLDVGSRLKVLTYDDQGPCKSIQARNLGYTVARNEHGEPIKFNGE